MADGFKIADAYVEVHARGHDRVGNEVRDAVRGDRSFDDAGEDAGERFGDGFVRDAGERLRDGRGRFAREGEDAGEDYGRGFSRGLGDGVDETEDVGDDAGERFGSAFFRRVSEFRERFRTEGEESGNRFGRGFGDGVDREHGNLLGRMRNLGSSLGDGLHRGLAGSLSRIGSLLTGALKLSTLAAGIAAIGAAAGAATIPLLAFVGELLPLGGLLAALPGIALMGASSFLAWKVATSGLGEVMGTALSGSADELEGLLQRMGENVQTFGREFATAVPALKDFQNAIQGAFLGNFTGQMAGWAGSLEFFKAGLGGVAAELGGMVRAMLDVGTSSHGITQLNDVLGSTQTFLARIREALTPLLAGFIDLGVVGGRWLASLSGGIGGALAQFGAWMSQVSMSGQAWAWMDGALAVLKQLWGILADLTGIINSVLTAVEAAGGSALGVFGQLLDALNTFLASARGQEILVSIFSSLAKVGKALMPVIEALAGALALIAPHVAAIAVAVGPVLTQAINAVAPALAALGPGITAVVRGIGGAVQAIAPALMPVGQAITSLLQALSPLLPIIGQVAAVIATSLAQGVQSIIPSLSALVTSIGQGATALMPLVPLLVSLAATLINSLLPAITPLIPVVAQMIAQWGQQLIPAIAPLIPIVTQLVGLLAGAFVQVWVTLAQAFMPLLGPLTQVAQALGTVLVQAITAVSPLLLQIATLVAGLLPVITPLITLVAQVASQMGQILVQAITMLVAAITPLIPIIMQVVQQVGTALLAALTALAPSLIAILQAFVSLLPAITPIVGIVGQLLVAFAPLITAVLPVFTTLIQTLTPIVTTIVEAFGSLLQALMPIIQVAADLIVALLPVVELLVRLVATVLQHVIPVIGQLITWIVQLAAEIIRVITPVISWLAERFKWVIDQVVAFFKYLYDVLVGNSIVPDLINSMKEWFIKGVQWILNAIEDLKAIPGKIGQWFGDMKDRAISHANDLVNWMVGLPNRLLSALGSVGNLLNNVGHDIIVGLWNGMVGQWEWFKNAIYNFFAGIMPQWVKDALGIRSPSTLFADQVGAEIPAGVAVGVTRNLGVVKSAAQQMVDAAVVGVTPATMNSPALIPGGDASTGASGSGRGLHIGQLTLQLQGIVDLRNPSAAARQFLLDVREGLRRLEGEYV